MLKTYSKSLDYLLMAAGAAHLGKPKKAAKHLAKALQESDFEETLDQLGQQQEQNQQSLDVAQDFDSDAQQQDFASALARLTRNAKSVLAGEDQGTDSGDDSDSDAEVAGSGNADGVPEGGDATSVTVEHAADESGSDSGSDTSSDDSEEEASLLRSAHARLSHQDRVMANRKAIEAALKKTQK